MKVKFGLIQLAVSADKKLNIERARQAIESVKKKAPCYILTENLAELCPSGYVGSRTCK